ncbi:MAG: dihydroorotase [Spirochaetaceae bacterium]|jgi:dihydroorotase|nr:dihydroorotase [Spirochaetaceae bacterium]
MKILIRNVRIVDEALDVPGALLIEDGFIRDVLTGYETPGGAGVAAALVIDGSRYVPRGDAVLMPALVDLHAHFRDPGLPAGPLPPETLESASLAAVAGGYGTVVCMANTRPVLDTPEAAAALRARSNALGLIDLYPALALTRGMAGEELSDISRISPGAPAPRLLSEDGRDVASDALFLAACAEARRLGLPVSCHCDAGGEEVEAAKRAGAPRAVWSRLAENNATRRALAIGKAARCHLHIAHVSTGEAAAMIREAKAECCRDPRNDAGRDGSDGFYLSSEATPHHIALTEEDARILGEEAHGRVNPPLRGEDDRREILRALSDGTIDAIATDHAPHNDGDKAGGAPGFTGLETAFGVCHTVLVPDDKGQGDTDGPPGITLSRLSALMSAAPARILGLGDRGRIAVGMRADLILLDPRARWRAGVEDGRSRGRNSPFAGRELRGRVLLTILGGRIVFQQ